MSNPHCTSAGKSLTSWMRKPTLREAKSPVKHTQQMNNTMFGCSKFLLTNGFLYSLGLMQRMK